MSIYSYEYIRKYSRIPKASQIVVNLLIVFLSESLVFAKKLANERFAHSLIFMSDLSESLMVAHFWVRDLSDSLTSLIFGERPERFAHIAH